MAGFGAGFGKGLAGSLDAAGKLYQQEQMRSREYERAKADRQAERLEERAWQKEDMKEQAEAEAEKDTFRYFEKDGKFYYTRTDNTVVERPAGDHGVNRYIQWRTEQKRATESHEMEIRRQASALAVDRAQIGSLNASAAAAGRRGNGSDDSDRYASLGAFIESAAKNNEIRYGGGEILTDKDGKRTYKEPSLKRTRQKDGTYKYDSPSVGAVYQVLGSRYPGRSDMTIKKIAQTAQGLGEEASYAQQTMLLLQPHLTFGVSSK